jgi:hypothetical protein
MSPADLAGVFGPPTPVVLDPQYRPALLPGEPVAKLPMPVGDVGVVVRQPQ